MRKHVTLTFPLLIIILFGLASAALPVEDSLSNNLSLPDIYTSQAQRPTKENGQYQYSVKSVTFQAGNHQVTADLYTPDPAGKYPAIVFGVGYTEALYTLFNSSNYKWIGESLASHGYVTLILKYAANVTDVRELSSLHEWINQTVDAVTYLQEKVGKADGKRIGLMGHGVGGAVAICTAAEDKRVKNVIALSPAQIPGVFQPSMYDRIAELSPVPVQIQTGGAADFSAATGAAVYNSAAVPKQLVTIQMGTYEGFTDIGAVESGVTLPIPWNNSEITIGTHQHDHSISYSISFLNYYLKNHDDYFTFLSNDYNEKQVILEDPTGLVGDLEYTWVTTQQSEELDTMITDVSAEPHRIDLAGKNLEVQLRASVVPRGVGWGNSEVKAKVTYGNEEPQEREMVLNTSRDINAGDFELSFEVEKNHDLDGDLKIVVEVVNTNGDHFTSSPVVVDLYSSSKPPSASLVIEKTGIALGKSLEMTIGGDDEDGVAVWYKLDYGNGERTKWLEFTSNPENVSYLYESSGAYEVKLWVKDNQGAESEVVKKTVYVSQAPVAKLKVEGEVLINENVKFDASASSDPDEDELEYLFVFGDGEETGWVDTAVVKHKYKEKGRYTVSLTVRDKYGVESETVTKEVKVIEEKEGTIAKILGGSGFSFLLIIIIVVVIVGGVYFVYGGKGEEEKKGAVVEQKPKPSQPAVLEKKAVKPQEKSEKKTASPLPKPTMSRQEKAKPLKPIPRAERRESAPLSHPPKQQPLPLKKNFAVPIITEEMKKKIQEKKKEKMKERESVKKEKKEKEEADNIQRVRCPECGKEFKVQLPEKKKETGKTICPRCGMKFIFKRKDWLEDKTETPEKQKIVGIDVIDLKELVEPKKE